MSHKRNTIRRTALLLALATLVCLLLSACKIANGKGSEYCLQYIEAITKQDYAAAFELIDTETKNMTGVATTRGDAMISYSEFTEKYQAIFDAIELTDVSYTIADVTDGTITASVNYTQTFQTGKAGELSYSYTVRAEYDGTRWGVLWTPALIFPTMQWGDNLLSGVNYPKRGEIFDANGELLAENMSPVTVYCTPNKIKTEDKETFITQVMAISELGLAEWFVRDAAYRTNSTVVLCSLYPDAVDDALKERILAVDGLGIDTNTSLISTELRYYPYGSVLSHVLGFASIIQKEDLDAFKEANDTRYDGDSWLGYAGLELQYEDTLRGTRGSYAYIQGKDGTNRQTLYNIPAVDGQDLRLTIKISLQERVEQVVTAEVYDDNITGTVIVLNPKTCAVEAMYSWPDYDPNDFSRGNYTEEQWDEIKNDVKNPMLNRAVQGLYAPGSTFKTLTAAALLESGTMSTKEQFPSSEKLSWDIWYPSAAGGEFAKTGIEKITRTRNTARDQTMNMENSIIYSDNIYFAYGALKMGWSVFTSYLESIGMTKAIPFDLPTQKAQIYNVDTEIDTGDTSDYFLLATTGYGQGELLLTPLQMACYISGFVNGGTVYSPYIVDSVWQASGNDYEQISAHEQSVFTTICTEETASTIASYMVGVCRLPENHGGTGKYLGVRSYVCAGKTGTAEIGAEKEKELAWFIAYRYSNKDGTPLADEDQRLVMVMLELDMTKLPEEYTTMKFNIMQELLKEDPLTEDPITEDIMTQGSGN